MRTFDCLSLSCPIFGLHLLEASAGTGKTFSIEHIFVRLILEGIEIGQILAVTFTRAAMRELKARIRSNLEKALHSIRSNEPKWPYLQPHLGSMSSERLLSDALAVFEECQIFTIHGFCARMLKEFSFEAKINSAVRSEETIKIPKGLRLAALEFLEAGIDPSLLCKEQLALLFREFESLDALVDRLVRMEEFAPSLSFSEIFAKCKAALHLWPLDESKLMEDFLQLQGNYKASVKGDFEGQVRGLANEAFFPILLKEKGSLFHFLHLENRKVRAEIPKTLHYPGFFDWARERIAPLVQQKVFPVLQKAFQPIGEKILAEEEYFDPDEILRQMQKSTENPQFKMRVQQKYQVAIIDEFQDTDALQWDIFQKLFLEGLRAFYLVGDPKQSIYRFRKADIYTYLKARDVLGEENCYFLGTNFRSSKSLIGALNALFERQWLHLPKLGHVLPYHPVQAGSEIKADFQDGKGAIHFIFYEGESLFEEGFIPYAAKEIETLQLKRCAILVKDRYQVEKVLECLKERGIDAVAKSQTPLGQTDAFQAVKELFDAVMHAQEVSATPKILFNPLTKHDLYLPDAKLLLEEKGLVPFAKELILDRDAMQIFELLFAWEKEEGFSFEGLMRVLKKLKTLDPEEGGMRRMEVNEDAVQIMTMHISKGLEFDVVFALGLATRTPRSDPPDEIDAEKMRQLYVTMTRAKKRLYVLVTLSKKEADVGAHSPIELFSRFFEGPFIEQIEALSKKESITLERISLPLHLEPSANAKKISTLQPQLLPRSFIPSTLFSFTTLAQTRENEMPWKESDSHELTLETMPRGSDTGIAIHAIFESLFSANTPLWRDPKGIEALVYEHLRLTPLEPWKEAIQKMVQGIVLMPLNGDGEWFTLSEIDRFQVEMEFVFSNPPDFVKGFIDLIFRRKKKVYFLDWKTNWLENYDPANLKKAMEAHDYGLQAKLYSEAILRSFKAELGGAFYVFVRGQTYIQVNFS